MFSQKHRGKRGAPKEIQAFITFWISTTNKWDSMPNSMGSTCWSLLTCFLALVLLRILQHKTNHTLSTHRIIEALQSALADPHGKGYCKVHANEDFIELLKQLKIPLPNGIEKIEKLKNYAKDWCTTK